MAIAALVLGILSVLGGFIFTGLPALILGYNGRSQVHRSNGNIDGLGMAWTGIIIGWVMVGLSILLAIGLVGSLFFVGTKVTTTAVTVTSSSSTVYNLKNAISTYFVEYRKFPIAGISGDTKRQSDASLMNILMAAGPASSATANPRGIVFFNGNSAKPFGSKMIDGIYIDPAGNSELFDRWGNYYQVIFDTNGDGQIADPITGLPVLESVLVWSVGADGILGTADDAKSW